MINFLQSTKKEVVLQWKGLDNIMDSLAGKKKLTEEMLFKISNNNMYQKLTMMQNV
jgi:hypothetical protein